MLNMRVMVVEFGTSRKRLWDFLLMINSNLSPISHRFCDTVSYWLKIANSPCPSLRLCHSAPSIRMTPFVFLESFRDAETKFFAELTVKIS